MATETNFNVDPYFDDYNEDKGFYKVLFRPGFAVQTRELNQLQSIIQNQISRFGDHIFREGAVVLGGARDYENDVPFVRVSDLSPEGTDISEFEGKDIVGATSGIRANVRRTDFDPNNNTFTLYIRYSSASETSDIFLDNELIEIDTDDSANLYSVRSLASNSTGKGTLFRIEEGVIYAKGYFITFPTQRIILSRYTTNPTLIVGFDISETIITSADDESLLDNSAGSFNFTAPGAHRFALGATLKVVETEEAASDPNFVPIIDVVNGEKEAQPTTTEYSRIYSLVANRTRDTDGDYYVRGFGIRTREYVDDGSNEGYLPEAKAITQLQADLSGTQEEETQLAGDAVPQNYISIDVEPGLAYVQGYEINTENTRHIPVPKSLDTNYVEQEVLSVRTGGYILVDEAVGSIPLDQGQVIDLYDTAENRVSTQTRSSASPSGNKIGEARVKSVVYESGTMGTSDAQYRVYLFDVQMVDGEKFPDVRGIHYNGTNDFFADTVLDSGETRFRGFADNDLIVPLGSENTETVRSSDGTIGTSFIFQRSDDTTIDFTVDNGVASINVGTISEDLPYGLGFLSTAQKREILLTVTSDIDFTLPGLASTASGSDQVVGNVDTRFTRLTPGDKIKIGANTYIIQSIEGDQILTLTENAAANVNDSTYAKSILAGDIIDLTAEGSSGDTRTALVTSSDSISFDIKEDVSTVSSNTVGAVVTYRVLRSPAREITKNLRPGRFVRVDCSALSSLTDPIDLGFSNVLRIQEIRKDTSEFTSETQGTVVTNDFFFDDGQRDNYYEHSSITPIVPLTSSDYLLVKLDYFEVPLTQGLGYFSVDSYPIPEENVIPDADEIALYEIPTYTNSAGTTYSLRNCLDFRPLKSNTSTDTQSVTASTVNPGSSSSFNQDANGLRIPAPDSRVDVDYSYYLARRDIVTLDRNGIFSVVRGEPATYPVSPKVPENAMALANIYVPPFPSISETLGRIIGNRDITCKSEKVAQIRHTQRDIGVLKQRIENLEYYNSLNLLEKSATDLQIVDDTGLDRFKNGFFVDGFLDHTLGATDNSDYNIAVDKVEKTIRPKFEMESFSYEYDPVNSSGVQKNGNLITLPYTEETLLEQLNVTTIRNIEQSVFRYIGDLQLTPDNDVWADTNTVDKLVEFGSDLEDSVTTEWGSWETYFTGYNVYRQQGGWTGLKFVDGSVRADADHLGSFTSYGDALRKARAQASYNGYINGVVEPVDLQRRSAIQTTVTYEKETQNIGNFVTDVSVIPYIRPQQITLFAQGLKANTRYYVFFDGEDMSEYVTPFDIPESGALGDATLTTEGAEIRSDAFGEVYGLLRLPASGKRFRVGNKEVKITDSPTNDPESTSYSVEYFYASGIDVQKQNTILSTKTPNFDSQVVGLEERERVAGQIKQVGPSCMAYSFLVSAPPEQEGVFLSSVDVFIESMHPTLGVWFEIREMDSGGNITRTQVPYSKVWMRRDDPRINFWDGTGTPVATNVNFETPVFLYNDTQYAFVIHTEGLNPDTYFWVSRLGEDDVLTGEPVTSRRLTGTLFTTNNNLNYDMVPDLDLMVRFNRAKFDAGSFREARLRNKPYEFLQLSDDAPLFNFLGEKVLGSEKIQLTNVSVSSPIVNTDVIVGSTSSVSANVVGSEGNAFLLDGRGFSLGEEVTIEDSGGTEKGSGTIDSIVAGSGTLMAYNPDTKVMTISETNGEYFITGTVTTEQTNETATINGFADYKYSTTNLKPDFLDFNTTRVSFQKRGYNNNAQVEDFTPWVSGNPDASSSFDSELTLFSRALEEQELGASNRSSEVRVQMYSETDYLSPVIDVSRAHAVYVYNKINSDTTGETEASGGDLLNKYISKIVTLDEGQDAEDLLVRLSMYRPPANSDILVWMRAKNQEDVESIEDKAWIPMVRDSNTFSSKNDQNNFIETDFRIPSGNFVDGTGFVYDSNNNTFSGFKQFQIKIGLVGDDSANVPRVGDLRAIALQL